MPRSILAFTIGVLVLTACTPVNQPVTQTEKEPQSQAQVQLSTPQEFAVLMKEEKGVLIDVHTPEQEHLPGTDLVIPYDQVRDSADQLPADKNVPLLVYCRSGGMSQIATRELVDMGYTNVYDLSGGIQAWNTIYKTGQEK